MEATTTTTAAATTTKVPLLKQQVSPFQDYLSLSERSPFPRHGDVQPERLCELPDPDPPDDVHSLSLHPGVPVHGLQCEVR